MISNALWLKNDYLGDWSPEKDCFWRLTFRQPLWKPSSECAYSDGVAMDIHMRKTKSPGQWPWPAATPHKIDTADKIAQTPIRAIGAIGEKSDWSVVRKNTGQPVSRKMRNNLNLRTPSLKPKIYLFFAFLHFFQEMPYFFDFSRWWENSFNVTKFGKWLTEMQFISKWKV